MNFLAHAFLAGPNTTLQLGGLVGDFVKGPLPAGLPEDIAAGVRLHRLIDSFADSNPAFQKSRARVSPVRRRVGGIMVDLFYDHFLARHWQEYAAEPLEASTAGFYELLEANAAVLPSRFMAILPTMRRGNWLASYASTAAVSDALDRMARHRFSRPTSLAGAGEELLIDYAGFEADFREFLPAAQVFSSTWRAENLDSLCQ